MIDNIGEYLSLVHRGEQKSNNYGDAVEYAERMAVHAYGIKPKELLEDYRPREESSVRDYRLSSYEPVTQSFFDDAVDILQKMFEDKRFSIEWKDSALQQYMTKDYPYYDNFINFTKETLLKFMLSDPNGLISVEPIDMDLQETEAAFPFVYLYHSWQVKDYQISQYATILLSEPHLYGKGSKGKKYKLITPGKIEVYGQEERNGDLYFVLLSTQDYSPYWQELSCWKAGGVPTWKNDDIYFESFFNKVIAPWNKAIRRDSDLDGAYVNHLHVQKWYVSAECDFVDQDSVQCDHGYLYRGDKKYNCPRCDGSGQVVKTGPFNDIRIENSKLDNNLPLPPIGFIAPPVDAAQMLEKSVDDLILKGLRAINMEVVWNTPLNQSGVAKEIDRSQMYDTMKKISDYMFDNHIESILYYSYLYRYGVSERQVDPRTKYQVNKPIEFNSITARELTQELSEAQVDVSARKELAIQYVIKRFPEGHKRIAEKIKLDPFYGLSQDEKLTLISRNTVQEVDMIISDNISVFVDKAFEENKNFDKLTYSQKYDKMREYAGLQAINLPEFATGNPIEQA